ncbi:MAG: hypothetical protein K9M54_04040 [Kiritimatiellales bacterium]|nr:hypothetical protein [Kiritimatiellales bacterium]
MRTLKLARLGFGLTGLPRMVMALAMGMAGIAAAASTTNNYVGLTRTLQTASNWSGGLPNNGAAPQDWLIGGPGFQNFSYNQTIGDLVNTSATELRLYADTIYLASGINNLSNTTTGIKYDLGFNFAGAAGNKIVVQTGFDIAADVDNNVILKAGRWVSSNAGNVITFNHNGAGILKINNDWIENTVGLVYKGSAMNQVAFGAGSTAASTWTGGTTLDNVAASLTANNSIGKSGNIVLTNGASLDMAGLTLNNNKLIAAAGADVKQITTAATTRTSDIEAQGNLKLLNSTGAAQWNGNVTIGSTAQLELANSGAAVSYLGGTLSGNGTLFTSGGTTVLNNTLDSSGFTGDIIMNVGVNQFRNGNLFGSGNITLNGSNFRGFILAADNLDYSFGNTMSVQANSRIAMTAAGGLTGNAGSVTANGDIMFTDNATLSLEAGGNIDNLAAVNTLNINGVIKEDGGIIGNVTVDNHWGPTYYNNSITKLSAANTYHGKTDVQFGRLQLVGDGSIDNSATLVVQDGGIFDVSTRTGGSYTYGGAVSGTGLLVGDLVLTGALNPGNSPGTLTFDGALTLSAGSTTTMEITDSAYDVLMGNGVDLLTMNGETVFDFTGFSGGVTNGYSIALTDLFNNWGSYDLAGATYSAAGLSGGQSLDFTGGNLTVIPEPATLGLIGMCSVMVLVVRRFMMI